MIYFTRHVHELVRNNYLTTVYHQPVFDSAKFVLQD